LGLLLLLFRSSRLDQLVQVCEELVVLTFFILGVGVQPGQALAFEFHPALMTRAVGHTRLHLDHLFECKDNSGLIPSWHDSISREVSIYIVTLLELVTVAVVI